MSAARPRWQKFAGSTLTATSPIPQHGRGKSVRTVRCHSASESMLLELMPAKTGVAARCAAGRHVGRGFIFRATSRRSTSPLPRPCPVLPGGVAARIRLIIGAAVCSLLCSLFLCGCFRCDVAALHETSTNGLPAGEEPVVCLNCTPIEHWRP